MNRRLTFSIRNDDDPNGRVIELAGEADMNAVPYLEEAIRVASEQASTVIVDLTETTFIDSPTIGVLVNWTQQLSALGGRLAIVCPSSSDILRVLRQIGLDQTLDIVNTRAGVAPAP